MFSKIKLFLWWKFIIKEDEFHNKLNMFYLEKKHKLQVSELSMIVAKQRDLAHRLDNGESAFEISKEEIVKAKIKL